MNSSIQSNVKLLPFCGNQQCPRLGRKCVVPCVEKVLQSWAQGRRCSPDTIGMRNGNA